MVVVAAAAAAAAMIMITGVVMNMEVVEMEEQAVSSVEMEAVEPAVITDQAVAAAVVLV